MDLGFGKNNQRVGGAAESILLQSTQIQERAVQEEINRFDALLNDDQGLEILRKRRLEELKKESAERQKWKDSGHGSYEEIGEGQDARDVGREFFEITKKSERVVVHFHRNSTRLCDHFHAHLAKLAPRHLETKFIKVNVEGCDSAAGAGAAFLVEKLGIVVMPTIIIVKDRKVVHHIRGFDELGGSENFSVSALEFVLGSHDGLKLDPDAEVPDELMSPDGVNKISLKRR